MSFESLLDTALSESTLISTLGGDLSDIPKESKSPRPLIIIMTAIIFITILALFELISSIVNNYYTHRAFADPRSQHSRKEVINTLIESRETINANMMYVLICAISLFLFIFIFYKQIFS